MNKFHLSKLTIGTIFICFILFFSAILFLISLFNDQDYYWLAYYTFIFSAFFSFLTTQIIEVLKLEFEIYSIDKTINKIYNEIKETKKDE